MNNSNNHSDKGRGVTIMGMAGTSGVPYKAVSCDLSEYDFVRQTMRRRGVEHFVYVGNLKARRLADRRSQIIEQFVWHLDKTSIGPIASHIDGDHPQQTRDDTMKRLLARDRGLWIPENISIIHFDDVSQASLMYPKLTTVRQSLEQMGQSGVEDWRCPPQRVALAT